MKINWKLFFLSVVILTGSLVTGCLFFLGLIFLDNTYGPASVVAVITGLGVVALSFILSYETKE